MVPKTVIIVDNDKFQRQLADMLLAVDNYNIVEFSNGKDTLQYLKEHTPDIALLATDLSDISGADICSKMKRSSRLKHIPVILISSQLQHETINALARAVHADLVLEKPLGDKHLREEVRKLLGQAESDKLLETNDDILILEDIVNSDKQEFFYMDTTLVEQTIPIKESRVPETDISSDSLPPLDEAASVEIHNIFLDANEAKVEDDVGKEIFPQELDIIDAIEQDLEAQNLDSDEDKTNINEVIAEQAEYEREIWRKELEPKAKTVKAEDSLATETKKNQNEDSKLLMLKSKLEELIEENESLKSALLELKSGKSLVTTESFLDSIEELEALRRLTESQQKQIQDLRRENKILRKSMESFLARQKNPLWGNRDSKIN